MKTASRILIMMILSTSAWADNSGLSSKTFVIPDTGWVHLVFFDIWSNPEEPLKDLPSSLGENVVRVGVQPHMNVTHQQLSKYEASLPESLPLLLDTHFTLMREYDVWELPVHILLYNGEKKFSGDYPEMLEFIESNNLEQHHD